MDFARRRLAPIADEIEKSQAMPAGLFSEMGRLGLLGLAISEDYGGTAGGFLASTLAMQELSKASDAVALSYGAHSSYTFSL